jgi:glycosyltransferase involved in cell wall biosynthesis
VIGANVGAVASLIDVDRDGLLFEYSNAASLAEAVSTLLANGALRRKMGIAGQRKTLNNYTWESVSEQFRRLYQEVWERYQNQ